MEVEVMEKRPHLFDDVTARRLYEISHEHTGQLVIPETNQFSIASSDDPCAVTWGMIIEYFLHTCLKVHS
jgi:hypothetical protein